MEVSPLHTVTSGLQRPPACLSDVDHVLPFLTHLCATHPHCPCRPRTWPPAHALRRLHATYHLLSPTAASLTPLPPRPSLPRPRVHCPPTIGPSLIRYKHPPPCPCRLPMLMCHLPCMHA